MIWKAGHEVSYIQDQLRHYCPKPAISNRIQAVNRISRRSNANFLFTPHTLNSSPNPRTCKMNSRTRPCKPTNCRSHSVTCGVRDLGSGVPLQPIPASTPSRLSVRDMEASSSARNPKLSVSSYKPDVLTYYGIEFRAMMGKEWAMRTLLTGLQKEQFTDWPLIEELQKADVQL